ncbi:MAG: DUF2946 family protein [Zoogloeaceae bacterium]|jgi:hypothetical protein|nr:DUF2946 family protein [Zoogloeaceae bacterium]
MRTVHYFSSFRQKRRLLFWALIGTLCANMGAAFAFAPTIQSAADTEIFLSICSSATEEGKAAPAQEENRNSMRCGTDGFCPFCRLFTAAAVPFPAPLPFAAPLRATLFVRSAHLFSFPALARHAPPRAPPSPSFL